MSNTMKTTVEQPETPPPHLAAELARREATEESVSQETAPTTAQNTPEIALKDVLIEHLSEQLGIEKDRLDVAFNAHDRATIDLTFPRCTFNIDTSNARALGQVTWQIVAETPQGQKKCDVRAIARTWQEHLVLNRPLSRGQAILDRDLVARRELTDKPLEDAIVDRDEVVGEQAARALPAGDVLTSASIQPTPLVEVGDMVMVKLRLPLGRTVSTVARAIDGGGKGQTIHAKNEANNDVYDVVVTGKLEGECKSVADIAAAKVASTGRENAIER
jgi:flagella basal body P-ring formation protein FlgA